MFIGFVRTCNTIQLGYKYLISKIQSVSNIGKCLQVDTTTTVHPSRKFHTSRCLCFVWCGVANKNMDLPHYVVFGGRWGSLVFQELHLQRFVQPTFFMPSLANYA